MTVIAATDNGRMRVPLDFVNHTPRLSLRRVTEADATRLAEIQANWNVTQMLAAATFPPSIEELQRWLRTHAEEWVAGTAYRFAIVCDGVVVGCADIDCITGGVGELGYWLDEAHWGHGLASEAAAAVLAFAVETVGLHRVVAGHAVDNPASGQVLRKLGFQPTGEKITWSKSRQASATHQTYAFTPPSPSECGD